jgi:hypothetical protein
MTGDNYTGLSFVLRLCCVCVAFVLRLCCVCVAFVLRLSCVWVEKKNLRRKDTEKCVEGKRKSMTTSRR